MWLNIKQFFARFSSKPWAVLETNGLDAEGGMTFSVYFNKAFVLNIAKHGFINEDDTTAVTDFFLYAKVISLTPTQEERQEQFEQIVKDDLAAEEEHQ